MRFFLFSPVSFIPRVSFASIRYRSVATALRPPYFMSSHRHLNDGLSHSKQVDAHEAIPSCSFAHLSSAMASSWVFFTSSIQSFSISHFPEIPPRFEGRA